MATLNVRLKNAYLKDEQEEVQRLLEIADTTLKKIAKNLGNIKKGSCVGCSKGDVKLQRARVAAIDTMLKDRGTRLPRRMRKERKKLES